MVDQSKDLSEVPRLQKRPLKLSLDNYEQRCESRDHAIVDAYQSGGYTMKEIGEYFGLSYCRVSRIVKNQNSRPDTYAFAALVLLNVVAKEPNVVLRALVS